MPVMEAVLATSALCVLLHHSLILECVSKIGSDSVASTRIADAGSHILYNSLIAGFSGLEL